MGFGQTVIYTQDFETPGGYTTSISEFNSGFEDYFERTNNPDSDVQFNNIQGSFYFAAQDITDSNTINETLTISNIDITGYYNLELKVYLAEDDDGSNEDWDGEDYVHFSVNIDGNGYNDVLNIEGQNSSNNAPQIDTDFNNIGDGTEITDTFTQLTANITGTGNTLNLEVEFQLNSGDEDIAIDQIEIVGIPASTILEFDQDSASISENAGTYIVDVNIANPNNTQTQVEVALTSGNATDVNNYTTQTLTFPPNSSVSQTLTLNITDNPVSNPDSVLEFTLQNPTGGDSAQIGTQDTFTLTILDDELAPPIALPYNEDFSNCATVEWTPYDEAGSNSWSCSSGEYSMNGFTGGTGDDIDWLVSEFTINFDSYSAIDIDVTTNERYGNAINEPGEFRLAYSTNYDGQGNPTTATWTDLAFNPNNTSTGGTLSGSNTTTVDATSATGIGFLAFIYDETVSPGPEDWRIQEVNITGTPANSNDSTTEVYEPALGQAPNSTQTAAGVTTPANSFRVLNFEVEDQGSGDGLPTNITQMRFVPGPNNTADWTDHIQGITLDDISNSYSPNVAISDSEIILDFTTPIVISDGVASEFELGVYLNTSNIEDDSVLQFQINANNSGFEANLSGSGFANPFFEGDVVGNEHTIDVEATELRFLEEPSDVDVSFVMQPAVQVAYTDTNGNADVFYSGSGAEIMLTSTGSFDSSATTIVEASNGVATFNNLIFDTESTGNTLSATDDSGLISGTYVSTTFDITPQSIIFEDFNDGDFTNNPEWVDGPGTNEDGYEIISDITVPNGNAVTDGSFLASKESYGKMSFAVPSTEVNEWQFSLATPDFNPNNLNYFGVVLMASAPFTGELVTSDFQGYYLRFGTNGSNDKIELWRKTGVGEVEVGEFSSSPPFDANALQDGLNIRVTRNNAGIFELFYSTGFDFTNLPSTSAGTLFNNVYNTSSYFGVFQNFSPISASKRVYIDNIDLGNSAVDSNSLAEQPVTSQPNPDTFEADVNTNVTNRIDVFKFDVQDIGTSDGLPTIITQLRLVPGDLNTALWSQTIGGIRITDPVSGDFIAQPPSQNLTINDNEIIVEIINDPNDIMSIPNGTTKEFVISVFLENSDIIEGEVIQLAIPDNSLNWEVASGSSEFAQNFTSFEGNTFPIEVNGNKLEFLVDASTTNINENMSPLEIAYTDDNGNIDIDFSGDISITSTGTLSGSPAIETPLNGVSVFSNLVHTAQGTNLTLTASSPGETSIISSLFDIIDSPELFITEVADPDNEANARYVEIYNSGVTTIEFNSVDYFIVRQANGSSINSIQLSGSMPPKSYYTIALDGFSYDFSYGNSANLISGIITGTGNDAYFLSLDNTDNTSLKNSMVDIYGEIDVDGTGDPWEYEDSRAYRNNPTIKNANTTWTAAEWTVSSTDQNTSDMTPGYGDNDYIYDGTDWSTNIYLPDNPDGVSQPGRNIFITSGTVTFLNDTEIGDLVVRSGATLELAPGVKLTVNGDIVNEGSIIFDSNDTATAVLEAFTSSSRVVGNGFEVRRRIPVQNGIRAFRYLSSSVDTQNSIKPFVFENWQESGLNTGDVGYQANFGTHITGTDLGNNLGFDASPSGNPSMWSWNQTSQVWASIPNTNATPFSVGDAYAILVRGDRSSPLNTNDLTGPSTSLRTTGQIHVGDFSVPNLATTVNQFSLVGNPYQSQVDLEELLDGSNPGSVGLDDQFVYIWDPALGTLGGYATVDINFNTIPEVSVGVPADSDANKYLQPQQAFFVETKAPSPSLTFTENNKNNSTGQTAVFSDSDDIPTLLDLSLKDNAGRTYDGIRLFFDSVYATSIDEYDAIKFWNYTDNLAILSNSNYISIEKRNVPSNGEITPLYLQGLTLNSYALEAYFYNDAPIFKIYILDHYTGLTSEILPHQHFSYSFTVDANIPETLDANRFEIVYEDATLSSPVFYTINSFRVYPNPVITNEITIHLDGIKGEDTPKIELHSLEGRLLMRFDSFDSINENSLKLNIKSSLSNGAYLLSFKTKETRIVEKIIIQR